MMKMRQTVVLKQEDSIVVEFEGRQLNLDISGIGDVTQCVGEYGSVSNLFDGGKSQSVWNNSNPQRDYELQGDILVAVKQMIEESRDRTFDEIRTSLDRQFSYQQPELSMMDKLSHYLSMLYSAQQAGHDVHKEIDEALKLVKKEIGI